MLDKILKVSYLVVSLPLFLISLIALPLFNSEKKMVVGKKG